MEMTLHSFARHVRRMRDSQQTRDSRRTAVAEARCETYQEVVDEMVGEILGPPMEIVRQDQSRCCGGNPMSCGEQVPLASHSEPDASANVTRVATPPWVQTPTKAERRQALADASKGS